MAIGTAGALAMGAAASGGSLVGGIISDTLNWLNQERVNEFNAEQAALDRAFQAEEAEKMRSFNSAEALKNREFQERMSNTQYQRAVQDLQKAGINPILAYQSSASSVPSGSTASSSAPSGSTAQGYATRLGQASEALSGSSKAALNAIVSSYIAGSSNSAQSVGYRRYYRR